MPVPKPTVITFKADPALSELLQRLPNRSDFIRAAVLSALENTCPLCSGTGVLSVAQREHLAKLMKGHSVEICERCFEPHLVCHHEAP